ncbi:DUF1885 family protein [Aneurinibacillus sp. Ricciae_BoGa-3]|uniref:DUF1885 family protein n=1 Tax=Aneurinibacillus sp. Ricciae_BoGa-3 TaxID=3022697 RepID=UPI00234089E1|nr:DUF1885 family protein [Aneurinibacillus sp. Ricciae_BoGa-3]WCK53124.1 DUF1885 family protein [Aneurinibacillus sp. Ricciae_BoGa-3]
MGKSAYIKFVEGSTTKQVTINEVKEKIQHYIEMTTKTGEQLHWGYNQSAFPYTLQEKPESQGQWFYLKGTDPQLYHYIIVGVGSKLSEGTVQDQAANGEIVTPAEPVEEHYIQVTLTDQSTHGDKGKAIEFCKYLGKEYKAELHLFNGRIMYYNPRK